MIDTTPLYNSRITKTYLDYINRYYPDVNIDRVLQSADITREEVEDQANWLTQDQVDRFQEAAVRATGNANIAREAGRHAGSSEAIGIAKHFILGLSNLPSLYLLISKLYNAFFSKAATIKTQKIGHNQIEIVVTPMPGVNEKPYQCQNRMGMFESVARLFSTHLADIEETSCFHKSSGSCRYLITWEKSASYTWKRIRNFLFFTGLAVSSVLFFMLPLKDWTILTLVWICVNLLSSIFSGYFENKELTSTLETQGNLAEDLLREMEIRHHNALLIQEIGQAVSSVSNVDAMVQSFVDSMESHMNFDRGLIFLHDPDKKYLIYKAGYGYSPEKEELLFRTHFDLTNPESQGAFVVAYKNQKPFLINNALEIENKLSPKSMDFARKMGVHSLICVPIVYEKESLGILAVDNIKSNKPLTKSDLSFTMGISSQMAVSIVNSLSYQKLEKSEKQYRDLVENANSIILRRNVNGEIIFFNKFTRKFFGFSNTEDISAKSMGELIFQKDLRNSSEYEEIVNSFRKNPDKQIISEHETQLPNGEKVWITWTYNPIFDLSGELTEVLCIGNDITELKKAELDKKDLLIRLQRAHKMEAIGTLAGGVAHDLNNILSGIVSYPELLLLDLPPDSRLRKPITTIQKAGERAAAIVQDLLTLARRGVVTKKVVNLNRVILDYVSSPEYENLLANHPGVKLRMNLDKNLFNILGSPIHLTKTLLNLVMNAAEAINDSGEIVVTTENRCVDRSISGFDKVKEGDYVTLVISDTGIGISPQDLERIFEPFYTKKIMGKSGTGLGMAVVWGTIKDHDAYIDVMSTEGLGTTFTLYFPVTRKDLSEMEDQTSISELKGNGEKILVIDDVPEQREIAVDILTKLGYKAASVESGEEAVVYLKNNSADLLILDMIMEGGIDGFETYQRILETNPDQKAIITSGFSESSRVKKAQSLGAGGYIRKPYIMKEIGRAIKKELQNQRAL